MIFNTEQLVFTVSSLNKYLYAFPPVSRRCQLMRSDKNINRKHFLVPLQTHHSYVRKHTTEVAAIIAMFESCVKYEFITVNSTTCSFICRGQFASSLSDV